MNVQQQADVLTAADAAVAPYGLDVFNEMDPTAAPDRYWYTYDDARCIDAVALLRAGHTVRFATRKTPVTLTGVKG